MADSLSETLAEIPEDASPEEAARILFPNDQTAQQEYLQQTETLQEEYERVKAEAEDDGEVAPRALPAFVVAALPVIARCVSHGLGAAGVNEVITLVHSGQRASAEARVYALVGGCIQGVIPVKWVVEKLKRPIATAVLWLILKWHS